MGLLGSTTQFQYYNQQQKWLGDEGAANGSVPRAIFTFPTDFTHVPATEDDFIVKLNGEEQPRENYTYSAVNPEKITFTHKTVNNVRTALSNTVTIATTDIIIAELLTQVLGDYRYISLKDIVNNFMIGYVGDGKLINTAKRSEVLFHAKRCIQEFNYDIGRVEKIQEIEIGPSLSIPMPQDYINYVRLSWHDTSGVEHIIYPARFTSRPSESILQDSDYNYVFSEQGDTITVDPLITERFEDFDVNNISGSINNDDYFYNQNYHSERIANIGLRFGLDPENAQQNGTFVIDEVNGKFGFSSNIKNKIVTLKYISDGLGTDKEMKIHKFAEEGMYKSLIYNMLSSRNQVPEYIINRYRKERRAAMRNAKIRLSNLKIGEITQVMRGKSKQIKH
tara:strand:- start:17294 stop:18472 length:1179 start_codon:yes stop_codon:yes gene_type:complete